MKTQWVLSLAALLTPVIASAADDDSTDTIIVTATRSEISIADAIVPVTVIDRERIELSLATDLAELLRFEAGLDIGRNGGPGQATSVFLRGTESNHTLVLMDGVRINPGTIGGAAIQNIAPELIERVEIVKGSRSSLYGTDAIGGVINIISRRSAAPFLDVGLGGGSFDQSNGFISGGIGSERGEIGASVNWQDTDGYAIRSDSDITRGYENLSASLYGTLPIGAADLTVRHWQASGNVEYLDFLLSPLDQDYDNQSTSLELENPLGGSGVSRLIVSYSVDDIEQNQSTDFVTSERVSLDWQYGVELGDHSLAVGVFAADEDASSLSFGSGFDEATRYQAVFLQDSLSLGRHRFFVSARYSDYDSFGSEPTWNGEYAFELSDQWTFNIGAGHAFRAPDATDRFGFGGNPDLDPEVAEEVQLGAVFRPSDRQSIRLELYANDIEDLIEFDFTDFTLQNIAEAEIRGAQLGYEYNGERFAVRADVVSQRADNAETGQRLLRRAEESFTLSYLQRIRSHQLGVSLLVSGDREDFAETLPGFTLVNLTGQFQLADRWRLNARIENLFDERYETAAGFLMQDRSAFVELSYRSR